MANTFITNTSKFKPFSFQEMLQPYAIYTDAYNKTEEELTNLDIMAGDVASKLNNPLDEGLRKQYQGFQDELNTAMNDLYDKGLTPDTKKKLAALKVRYTKDLNPINEAYKAYQTDQEYINKMAIEHPEILIEGAGKSVSDYIGGKTPQMRSVNTEDLMNQAMTIAKTQAGRTYRESGWTSTAGGRFLERTTEIGLNDADFNSALFFIENPDVKASDLGITEAQFNKIKNNAYLIESSMDDIINTPDFEKLSPENKRKAMNSIIKGIRAGFQYDKKTSTESDPMFAHNLALERDALKRQQDVIDAAKKAKKDATSNIGSSTYRAVNLGKRAVDKYLTKDQFGNYTISDKYQDFINSQRPDGMLKNRDFLTKSNKYIQGEKTVTGIAPQFNFSTSDPGNNLLAYDDFVSTIEQLGLDPSTATREQIIKRMVDAEKEPDAFGRKRASIVTPDIDLIQTYIERGLGNNKLQEIEGFEKGEDGVFRYKNKESVKLDKLLDDKGKLNILSIDMDYTTGERTFTIKDKDGKLREFRMPDDASFEAEDVADINRLTNDIRILSTQNPDAIDINTGLTVKEALEQAQQDADLIFASILNYMGKNNIN